MSLSEIEAEEEKDFNFEGLLIRHKYSVFLVLFGLIFLGGGIFLSRESLFPKDSKVEILEESMSKEDKGEVIVEISGAVKNPGVYKLPVGSRVEDALVTAGGILENADRNWIDKTLNRAAKLSDGQKIFIPKVGESNQQTLSSSANNQGRTKIDQNGSQTLTSGLVNINTASLSELDKLPGIGPVYGQSIIDHRPYSKVEELVSKGALKESVYEKIKDKVTVY